MEFLCLKYLRRGHQKVKKVKKMLLKIFSMNFLDYFPDFIPPSEFCVDKETLDKTLKNNNLTELINYNIISNLVMYLGLRKFKNIYIKYGKFNIDYTQCSNQLKLTIDGVPNGYVIASNDCNNLIFRNEFIVKGWAKLLSEMNSHICEKVTNHLKNEAYSAFKVC